MDEKLYDQNKFLEMNSQGVIMNVITKKKYEILERDDEYQKIPD